MIWITGCVVLTSTWPLVFATLEVSISPFVVGLVVFEFVSRFLFDMAVDFEKKCRAGKRKWL